MKLFSWNVNGIRAAVRNGGLPKFLAEYKPDVLGLQEIKIKQEDIEKMSKNFSAIGGPASGWDFKEYEECWNPAQRPGYSGTAVFTNNQLSIINYQSGLGVSDFDNEGRVQALEFEKFYFVNCYFPNSNHELSRLKFKCEFNNAFLKYVKKLEKKKPVIFCGDLNVAHNEIDLKNPKENIGNPGFTYEEREWMDKFVKAGFIDTFRHFHPKKIQYSWWSYRFGARARNIGWRIDYFMVSPKIIKYVKDVFILDKFTGSDHCPVGINLDLK